MLYPQKSKSSCQLFEERLKSKELAPLPPLPSPRDACSQCYQSGYVWLRKDTVSVWAYCDCVDGTNRKEQARYKIPQYSIALDNVTIKEFPVKAFYPRIHETVMNQLNERMREFEKDLELSEKFWNNSLD